MAYYPPKSAKSALISVVTFKPLLLAEEVPMKADANQ